MYYLIYDHFAHEQKYKKDIAHLETHLTDFGIPFKTGRLSLLKNLDELITLAERYDANTVVAVGGDGLIGKVVNAIAEKPEFTLGVVPLGTKSLIADFLGVHKGKDALSVLSARVIETIDLGKINDHYFLISAEVENASDLSLGFDADYRVQPIAKNQTVGVYNFNYHKPRGYPKVADPQDGILNAMVIPKKPVSVLGMHARGSLDWGVETVIPTTHVRLTSGTLPVTVIADRTRVFKTPLTITVKPRQLKAIVGKDRQF